MISSLVCASLGEVMVGYWTFTPTPATIKSTNHQPPTEGDNS